MPNDTTDVEVDERATPQVGEVLSLVRGLIVWTLVAGFCYSMFSTASQGRCFGGTGSDGGFIDAAGHPTDTAPLCVTMTLRPSLLVYLMLALVVVWAVTRAARLSHRPEAAAADLHRGTIVVVLLAVLAAGVAMSSFRSPALDRWDGTGTPPIPGWISVDVSVRPMSGS